MQYAAGDPNGRATVVIIGEGNVCRSPYIEYALKSALDQRGGEYLDVTSVGIHAQSWHRIADPIRSALALRGVDTRAHRPVRATKELLEAGTLLLTVDSAQRSAAVQLMPRALRRTFTVRQFARLAVDNPRSSASLTELVEHIAEARGLARPSQGMGDDIESLDSVSSATLRRTLGLMQDAVDSIADSITQSLTQTARLS